MTSSKRTYSTAARDAAIREARTEWNKACPGNAMAILARGGSDMIDRRAILRAWGVSFDDQIDYSSDSFLRDCGYGPDGQPLTVEAWACTDCSMLFANGETPPEMTEDETWAWQENIADRTAGYHVAVGDEEQEFSWTSCDTCGSRLGGSRHAVTLFPVAS